MMAVVLTAVVISKGNARKKARVCFILMFIFAAIRYGIGYDYYNYMQAVLHQVEDYSLNRFEPFSRGLIEIGNLTHYQFFFVLASFLTLYPVYKCCIKLSVNPAFSLLLYFLFPMYYLESFSIIRNAIAYSWVLCAFVMLRNNKKLWSFLMIIIAMMFHKSAAIGILIYPLYYFKPTLTMQLILFIGSFLISNLAKNAINEYSQIIPFLDIVERYTDYAKSGGGSMTYIINGICVFNLVFWNRMISYNSDNFRYLTLYNIGGCIWNIFLPLDSTLALRLSSYFLIFIIFICPQYKYAFSIKHRNMVNYYSLSFFFILFLSYFIINANAYLQKPERMSNVPYQTIFYFKDYSNYKY